MVEIRKFEVDFVERTKEILIGYDGEHTFSNLLNCSLGLLILPYENISSSNVWQENIYEIDSLPEFEVIKFEPVQRIRKNGRPKQYPKTLEIFLKKLRNGLAHQCIVPINSEGTFMSVRIFNKYANKIDFEVIFSENQLRDFALFIADLYLTENSV